MDDYNDIMFCPTTYALMSGLAARPHQWSAWQIVEASEKIYLDIIHNDELKYIHCEIPLNANAIGELVDIFFNNKHPWQDLSVSSSEFLKSSYEKNLVAKKINSLGEIA